MATDEPIKVMLVDDHPVVRQGLRAMLASSEDIAVVGEAGDGLEAIEKVKECCPQVILMDIHMPKMGGIDALRELKSRYPTISIIMLTMYDNDAYVIEAVKAGAGGYLLKDASIELLLHTIRAVNSGGILIKTSLLQQVFLNLIDVKGLPPAWVDKTADKNIQGKITQRELDVIRLITEGKGNREIGQVLCISEDTVKKHVQSMMAKLGVSDRTQAAVVAVRTGLVPFSPPENK
jgi:two-component system response regulator DegU